MHDVTKTKHHSWCTGELAQGCRMCVRGRKLVLFITGLCAQRCFYCPVSEQKFGKDVVFANEWHVHDPKNPVELIDEVTYTGATGAGITGGDPLMVVDRCCDYIRLLKKTFGTNFHTHLYTPLKLVTPERLQKLAEAGLDEIRFHLTIDDNTLWHRLDLALPYNWNIGVEIPAIPNYDTYVKALIDFVAGKIDFLNLNELERSDTTTQHYALDSKGYKPKDSISYGVEGSAETAQHLLSYAATKGLSAHFCTAKLKDAVQVKNRIKLRAKNTALPTDTCTPEGLLLRGCIYLPELTPSFGYRKKLAQADTNSMTKKLMQAQQQLQHIFGSSRIVIDPQKCRLLVDKDLLKTKKDVIKSQGFTPALVEEYPTADAFEVTIDFL